MKTLNEKIVSLTTLGVFSFVFVGGVFAEDIVINQNTTWVTETYTYDNVHITNGATLIFEGVVVLNAQNVTIDSNSSIFANGKGYGSDGGPGAGGSGDTIRAGGGAGYGGSGGSSYYAPGGSPYGSISEPSDLGSGGGHGRGTQWATGGAGGGAIRLMVGGTLSVDGALTANGKNGTGRGGFFDSASGGGSGGSIYVTAGMLTGSGVISAKGGAGGSYGIARGSGGGGGRIAIYYNSDTFTGTLSVCGGSGYQYGGAGTIFTKLPSQTYGELLIDNNNNTGAVTPINETITFDNLIVQNKAELNIESNAVLDTTSLTLTSSGIISNNGNLIWATSTFLSGTNIITNKGHLNAPSLIVVDLTFYQRGSLNIADHSVTVDDNGVFVSDVPLEIGGITVNSGGVLTYSTGGADLDLTITGNLTVNPGGSIFANGKGYGSDGGPGAGGSGDTIRAGGGAGYGGSGGSSYYAPGGSPYGSISEPSDLGSGGGHGRGTQWATGGAGGGAIRLMVGGTLSVDGALTANGKNGTGRGGFFDSASGGGSGGSIYVTAGMLTGSGVISAKGGAGGSYGIARGGGGGGGRIAIYYNTDTFTGTMSAYGGSGYEAGEDGTIAINPGTNAGLSEKSASQSTLVENIVTQIAIIDSVTVTGDLSGTLNFTSFEIVSVESGSFAGKGFSKGQWQANLEGLSYAGDWKGFSYLDASERKIYLKGAISGEISGLVEGYLTESVPGSGVYDEYQATWKLSQLGTESVSGTINLAGTVTYLESSEYPSTELYVLQTSIEGNSFGHYSGPLSTVLTHIRIADSNNPYSGEGFSIISYVSDSGTGQGWTYDQVIPGDRVELNGMFDSPLYGIANGVLDESELPRTLFLTIRRVDLGLPPAPDLKVRIWGPTRASPGQTVTYIVELNNYGLKSAESTTLVGVPPTLSDFVQATSPSTYDDVIHMVRWDFNDIPAKSTEYLSFQTEIFWGLAWGTTLGSHIWDFPQEEGDWIFQHSTPGLSPSGKSTLEALWGLTTYPVPSPFGEIISLAMAADVIGEGVLIAALGRARIEYQIAPIYGNMSYWKEMYGLLYVMVNSPEALENGWATSDGQLAFSADARINNVITDLREHYQYTSTNVPGQTATLEMRTARDPSVKYGPEGRVSPGEKLDYRVEYENEGEGIAFGVYFTDTLDEDLNDLTLEIGPVIDVNDGSIISGPGTYNPATRTITWFAGEVGPNEGGYADLSVDVKADANEGTEIINFATIYFPSVPEETRTNGIVSIVLLNQPPVADAGDDQTAFVGIDCLAQVTLDGSDSNDPDGDELGYTWLMDGEIITTGVSPIIELPLGAHTITLIVNDGTEDSEPDVVVITVLDNTPPVISNVDADWLLAAVGQTVSFSADVVDECDDDVDVEWNFGDGSPLSSEPNHAYGQPNIYNVTITATDDCGNQATDSIIIVVYDPGAGFTSGGGWFVPDGDSFIDGVGVTDTVSKANFGFIVKYKKGADNPDGNLEFQYKAGDINLRSSDMEWLVVQSETKVRFKGKATINGEGLYTFKVTAEDNGEPGTGDWFKIEIWLGPGVDTENSPPAPKHKAQGYLGGGNVQIHQK